MNSGVSETGESSRAHNDPARVTYHGWIRLLWVDSSPRVGLAELIRIGQLSPLELIDDMIERIEMLNPLVNSVIRPDLDEARETASNGSLDDGPFYGVPAVTQRIWLKPL